MKIARVTYGQMTPAFIANDRTELWDNITQMLDMYRESTQTAQREETLRLTYKNLAGDPDPEKLAEYFKAADELPAGKSDIFELKRYADEAERLKSLGLKPTWRVILKPADADGAYHVIAQKTS